MVPHDVPSEHRTRGRGVGVAGGRAAGFLRGSARCDRLVVGRPEHHPGHVARHDDHHCAAADHQHHGQAHDLGPAGEAAHLDGDANPQQGRVAR